MYARGILFGKMKYELGDHAVVRCPETGLEADIEFKVKGWMGGTYNAIGGFIKDSKSGKNLFELSGFWHGEMHIKDLATGKKEMLFNATHAKPSMVKARPLAEQTPRESQRLWDPTTRAIKKADQKVATDEKTKVEDEQRKEAAERGEDGWRPKLFKAAPAGDEEQLDWVINATVDVRAPPKQQVEQILAIAPILPGQGQPENLQQSKSQPSEQSKPRPSQQQQPPQAGGRGGDLIDFGQNDPHASAVPSQPTRGASNDLAAHMGNLNMQQSQSRQPQSSSQPSMHGPGNPLRRQDSSGGEDTFIDAET